MIAACLASLLGGLAAQPPVQGGNPPQGQGQPAPVVLPEQRSPQGQGQPPTQGPPTQGPPQNPGVQEPMLDERLRQLQGRIVREIRVAQARNGAPVPVDEGVADRLLRGLLTKSGQPLEPAKVSQDCSNLFLLRRLTVGCYAEAVGNDVALTFVIFGEDKVYERVEFRGLRHFDKTEIGELLGLYPDRQVTTSEAKAMQNILVARFKRDGYAFCSVDMVESDPEGGTAGDRPRKVLTFALDEGPKVTVRTVRFRGNVSFPGDPTMGIFNTGDHLVRSAHIQSGGSWGFVRGEPFSREIVDEDLDRLRLFYRSRGFLDAMVELVDPIFSQDRSEVDLEFRVVEGKRYSIRSVRIVHVDDQQKVISEDAVTYKAAEVATRLKVRAGDFYDHDRIRNDIRAIQAFYGERGHPARQYYSRNIPDAYFLMGGWPLESYTADAQVDLVFQVFEGKAKSLRDVLIRGNTATRDRVIRRKIYVHPGERIDMTKVERSIRYLEATRYFQDPITLAGPRFELLPSDTGQDQVDLAIDLKDGETGEFRWGIGISTGAGAQATIQFNKRNFDLWNPPSSFNPITVFSEIIDNKAFHGGGQQLDMLFAPGTEISQFQITYTEPDLFGQHIDTVELRTDAHRRVRHYRDGYTTDTLGGDIGLNRRFTEEFSVGVSGRIDSINVKNLAPDAPQIAYDAKGQTELRSTKLSARYQDFDDPRRPSSGVEFTGAAEYAGGILGGEADYYKGTVSSQVYVPLWENQQGHRHVLRFDTVFGVATGYGQSQDVYLTERFYIGGANLRGFDYRGAGPSQFGRAIGGEAVFTSSLEYIFPLVSTRLEREVRDRELLRGVGFIDFGLLGLTIDDPTFREPHLSVGFGIRIEVPVLEIPIALDLGWPLMYEETDNRRQLYFSIAR